MLFMTPLAIAFSLLNVVSSTTFYVAVGRNGTCDYEPQFLTGLKIADVISFEFESDRVLGLEQYQLCLTRESDALTNAYPSVWTTTITDATTPLSFYCTLPSHCPDPRKAFAIYPTDREAFLAQHAT